MSTSKQLTLAIFASDKGPGDAGRSSLMSQTGALLAKKGAKLVCLGENEQMPLPAITSARAAGGDVALVADESFSIPNALDGISVERIAQKKDRLNRLAELADCFVGLPGSLASATSLYFTVAELEASKPIVLLNHNNAFEIIRGISIDVFAHSFPKAHKSVQFAESVEDVWTKVARLTS